MKTIWKLALSVRFQSLISSRFPHLWNVSWVKPSLCDQEANILYLWWAEKWPATTMHSLQEICEVRCYSDEVLFLAGAGGELYLVGFYLSLIRLITIIFSNPIHPRMWVSKAIVLQVRTSLQSSCLLWLQTLLGLHFSNSLWGSLRVSLVSMLKETFPWLWKTNINFQNRKKLFHVKAGEADGGTQLSNEWARGGQNWKMASKIQPRSRCTLPVYPLPWSVSKVWI